MTDDTGIHCDVLDDERGGLGLFVLTADFTAQTVIGPVTVPKGYVTDFASIPRVARWLLPQAGHSAEAGLLHDWLNSRDDPALRRAAVKVFNDELRKAGAGVFRRWVMVAAVFLFTFPNVYLFKPQAS